MVYPNLFPPPLLSVSDLTRYLRQVFESDELLQDVWVQGEVSNLSKPSSGHIYFTLKDERASLRCVIWRPTAERVKAVLQNGMAVEAHGAVSVYEVSGQYQLYIDVLRPGGEGLLYQEFLRLKTRLEAEGIFDSQRKRGLPDLPLSIGIVTSPTGAALQDMLNTLRSRYPLAEVTLCPAAVQGREAPLEIVAALETLNRQVQPDVILLGRGGGSLEDLWAFNDERVVRAIAASQAPVVTGIGHETDFTLADFAADLRAPTPTGAVVLATPDKIDLQASLQAMVRELNALWQRNLSVRQYSLSAAMAGLRQASPVRRFQVDRQRLDEAGERARRAFLHTLELQRLNWRGISQRLHSISPSAVLNRGYAIVRDEAGSLVRSVEQVRPSLSLQVTVADGEFGVRATEAIRKQTGLNGRMDTGAV